jgi:hypothetical protein
MYRLCSKVLILLIAFSAGFAAATLRAYYKSQQSRITFSSEGWVSAFRSHYHSSDGKHLLYGCYEHESPAAAERALANEVRPGYSYREWPDGHQTPISIVERTTAFDGNGNKSTERAVVDSGEILWTEGARLHRIWAPSVEYALLFERSRSWTWEGCAKVLRWSDASR